MFRVYTLENVDIACTGDYHPSQDNKHTRCLQKFLIPFCHPSLHPLLFPRQPLIYFLLLYINLHLIDYYKKEESYNEINLVCLVLLNTVILRYIHVGYVSCLSLSSNPHMNIVQGVYTFTC